MWLVQVASINTTTSAYSGFSKQQYFDVLSTDGAGGILPGSERYWYYTSSCDYKDMVLT